jgi:hypothetical protein
MNRRSPLLRKRILLPLAAVVVTILVAPFVVPGGLIRDLVVRQLTQTLGRPVAVESVKTALLPSPRVELRGLSLEPGGAGPLVSLTVDRIALSLAFGPLLLRQIEVTTLAIEGPRAVVQVPDPAIAPAGRGAAAPRAAASPMRVNIRSLTITDGAATVRRADGALLLELGGLGESLTASLAPGGDLTLAGRTTLDTLRLHAPQGVLGEGLKITWQKDLRWEAAPRRLTIAGSTLSLGDLPVTVTGTVASVGAVNATGAVAPEADLKFTGGPVQVSSLIGFLPAFLAPQLAGTTSAGEIALGGMVKGPLKAPAGPGEPLPFAYDLRFDLTGGRVSAPALPAPLSGIELHVRAHDDIVEIARFAAATPRSRLAASGTMSRLLTTPQVALRIEADVDLAEAMALQPPQPGQPEMAGRFTGTVNISGPVAPPSALVLDGEGRLQDVRMSGPDLRPSIDRIDGPIRLRGQQLIADGVVFRQGTTDLTVSGTVDNYLALVPEAKVAPPAMLAVTIDGRRLDADQYAVPRGTAKDAAGASAGLARLALVSGRADVTMDRLLTRGHELQDVAGVVRLDRGLLRLEGVRGKLYDGRVDLAGDIDLRDPKHGGMDLNVKLAGVQAAELSRRAVAMSKFARLGGLVTGLIDGQATLKGALDDTFGLDLMSFTTNGQIEIRQARLAGSPLQKTLAGLLAAPQLEAVAVSEWLQPFRLENGKLHVDGLKLTAAGVGIRAGGWQALDGAVEIGVEMTVPQNLAEGLRAKLPAVVAAALFDGSGAPLVVPVGLTGRWDAPTVQLDTGAMAAAAQDRATARVKQQVDQAKQQVTDKVTAKVTEQVTEQMTKQVTGKVAERANQALGGLLGQSADTAGAGADTAQAPAGVSNGIKSILKGLRGGKGK